MRELDHRKHPHFPAGPPPCPSPLPLACRRRRWILFSEDDKSNAFVRASLSLVHSATPDVDEGRGRGEEAGAADGTRIFSFPLVILSFSSSGPISSSFFVHRHIHFRQSKTIKLNCLTGKNLNPRNEKENEVDYDN